jgi:hypothetical protein
MYASRQRNEKLAEELEVSRTQVQTVKAELEQVKNFTREAHGEYVNLPNYSTFPYR